jgi:hypothetical protein
MKLTLLLLLTLLLAATTANAQSAAGERPTYNRLSLAFELQDIPGLKSPESLWEVSYQWRVADLEEFHRWADAGADSSQQDKVGILLSKRSFARRDLSKPENRRFSTSVKLSGDLLRRMRNAGQQPQIVWLDATVRIRDGALGTEIVRKVNPSWGPDFYLTGVANVRMELTQTGAFRWTRRDVPPWAQDKAAGVSMSGRQE